MKKSRIWLAFLALALAVTTVLPGTWAYFTANARAGGGRTVRLQNETEIEESFSFGDWEKKVTITAAEGTQPVWVRARAYSAYGLDYATEGTGWSLDQNDGWYYFNTPLANPVDADGKPVEPPQWTTTEADVLRVHVQVKDLEPGEVPEDFDVVVVYETTPVTYNEQGEPQANWNMTVEPAENGGAAS